MKQQSSPYLVKTLFTGLILLLSCSLFSCSSQQEVPETSLPQEQIGDNIYIGYYQEDASNNPEDPTSGSIFIQIPQQENADFSGDMHFSFYGCQSENIGKISGNIQGNKLTGKWSGGIDGTDMNGQFNGSHKASQNLYSGSYDVTQGKTHVIVQDCIEYFVAAKGSWKVYPLNTSSAEAVNYESGTLSWESVDGGIFSSLSIIDIDALQAGKSAGFISQDIFPASQTTFKTPSDLQAGKYAASIIISGDKGVLYTANKVFEVAK